MYKLGSELKYIKHNTLIENFAYCSSIPLANRGSLGDIKNIITGTDYYASTIYDEKNINGVKVSLDGCGPVNYIDDNTIINWDLLPYTHNKKIRYNITYTGNTLNFPNTSISTWNHMNIIKLLVIAYELIKYKNKKQDIKINISSNNLLTNTTFINMYIFIFLTKISTFELFPNNAIIIKKDDNGLLFLFGLISTNFKLLKFDNITTLTVNLGNFTINNHVTYFKSNLQDLLLKNISQFKTFELVGANIKSKDVIINDTILNNVLSFSTFKLLADKTSITTSEDLNTALISTNYNTFDYSTLSEIIIDPVILTNSNIERLIYIIHNAKNATVFNIVDDIKSLTSVKLSTPIILEDSNIGKLLYIITKAPNIYSIELNGNISDENLRYTYTEKDDKLINLLIGEIYTLFKTRNASNTMIKLLPDNTKVDNNNILSAISSTNYNTFDYYLLTSIYLINIPFDNNTIIERMIHILNNAKNVSELKLFNCNTTNSILTKKINNSSLITTIMNKNYTTCELLNPNSININNDMMLSVLLSTNYKSFLTEKSFLIGGGLTEIIINDITLTQKYIDIIKHILNNTYMKIFDTSKHVLTNKYYINTLKIVNCNISSDQLVDIINKMPPSITNFEININTFTLNDIINIDNTLNTANILYDIFKLLPDNTTIDNNNIYLALVSTNYETFNYKNINTLELIGDKPRLYYLSSKSNILKNIYNAIGKCVNLTTLNLNGSFKKDDKFISDNFNIFIDNLGKLTNLNSLNLAFNNIDDDNIRTLQTKLTSLKNLDLVLSKLANNIDGKTNGINVPSTTARINPSTTARINPSTTALIPPSTTALILPSTTALIPPSTTALIPPSTTALNVPSTTALIPPSTTAQLVSPLAPEDNIIVIPSTIKNISMIKLETTDDTINIIFDIEDNINLEELKSNVIEYLKYYNIDAIVEAYSINTFGNDINKQNYKVTIKIKPLNVSTEKIKDFIITNGDGILKYKKSNNMIYIIVFIILLLLSFIGWFYLKNIY